MAYATFTPAQISTLRLARQHSTKDVRKAIKKEIFALAKERYGIPADIPLTVLTAVTKSGENAADVGVIKGKLFRPPSQKDSRAPTRSDHRLAIFIHLPFIGRDVAALLLRAYFLSATTLGDLERQQRPLTGRTGLQ